MQRVETLALQALDVVAVKAMVAAVMHGGFDSATTGGDASG